MAPGDKYSKSHLQSRELSFNAHKRTTTALPRVPVRSNAGRFERDGGLQCQNTWQNRDLRPLLPPDPTGLGGPRSQPRTLPADFHGGVTGAAGRRPCAFSRVVLVGN